MEAVCGQSDRSCEMRALNAALHSLHLYCATITAGLMYCCSTTHKHYRYKKNWRAQNVRGVASLALFGIWCCGAAAALLRRTDTVRLVSALMAPLAWIAAACFHVALWNRQSSAPILYLAIYWSLSAVSAASILWQHIRVGAEVNHIELYIQGASLLLSLTISAVDCACFYEVVTKHFSHRDKTTNSSSKVSYKHNSSHFYSKISFYWINGLLYKGYESPLEMEDLGELPDKEKSVKYYKKFHSIYKSVEKTKYDGGPSIWTCYLCRVWPNFYIGGILKLLGDLIGLVPPLGLAFIIQFIESPISNERNSNEAHVTLREFIGNGYVMLLVITLALIYQALLSQNSTHLVTVEGARLKTALQAMIYDKCMRIASWTPSESNLDEDSPLLMNSDDESNTRSGLITNLVSQDTYNIMSCVWICHYIWAIPLKVAVILYLLYMKLGVSAIIGAVASVLVITPLQFLVGKKLSDNSKDISKCTDHRISKMTEILQGITVIKLYVWEDLFKEKILQLREVELKLLNKDSLYWSFLTFSTQVSTILITVITFTVYFFIEEGTGLTAMNVFAGLAFFNQLSVPLLILPVTVLMIIQAMVSTRRIKDFLDLPESNNVGNEFTDYEELSNKPNVPCNDNTHQNDEPSHDLMANKDEMCEIEFAERLSNESHVNKSEFSQLVTFRNAAFTWGVKDDLLEVGDLEIPSGKLIMVVGGTSAGKSSFLSALIGEMYLERGDVLYNRNSSKWYAGQPPWLLEASVRDNIIMGHSWCQKNYARVLRATGLRPDLQLLPEGDATRLGSHGTPLSGGQRIRVSIARALYSKAQLLALDEPLAALDAALARHVVARGLVPAVRAGRTIVLATNRLELLHYADLIIAMDNGRVSGYGRVSSASNDSYLSRWVQLASEARAAAARGCAGPPDGTARERARLVRVLSRAKFQRCASEDTAIGITEAAGAHLLAEVPMYTGGSWRRVVQQQRPPLMRQFSSPPPSSIWRREIRRTVSADESNTTLQREVSLLRRWLRPQGNRTLRRWTPRNLRRLISSESDTPAPDTNGINEESLVETTYSTVSINGGDTNVGMINDESSLDKSQSWNDVSECKIWLEYGLACGWWGIAFWMAAATAQGLALAADYWLMCLTNDNSTEKFSDDQLWSSVRKYGLWCAAGAGAAGAAQAACACAGAGARRVLHERLLHAALYASPHHHHTTPTGTTLHRFSADVLLLDKKLPTAISRWTQLALLCAAAMLVNAVVAPWSLTALIPAFLCYLCLQSVYLRNSRELQQVEGQSAGRVVSLCRETCAGGSTIRASRLQTRMRTDFLRRLDYNHNALLLLNTANRWLGLSLDLVGAASVCVSLCVCMYSGSRGAVAGLAGAYSLLLPAYLAHLAKCRADLDQQLAALHRIHRDTNVPREDYREHCSIPANWQRSGKIEFQNVSVQHEPNSQNILNKINISIAPGEKVAICGRSGSGKSTLLMTCVGATSIAEGRVLIDGQDVSRVPLRALRHRVVVLPQEPAMFSGTLRENLDPLAVHTDEEIWHSLKVVGLYDFVSAQSAGLECSIAGRGGWSAGRAARACAARAALHARLAAALLLDEPAAALDAAAERALLTAMARIAPDTTIITVAHRISSVRGYDRAVVLEEGRVVEQGEVGPLLSRPVSRLARMLAAAHTHV
ncbi:ATP-binding cassette sub-family C member Sur-like isoform X1 [Bombyx mandarina]|uniref:ATP-binding cassette sub-family C member Sur-like isoform X1 n=1 Tax=Bombyx mandarina TaxID=7092 RepID=A0A6J2K5Q2_BOMMA|nr:ATP-binding cassette sub-family C member Sur-like isoform X1 [Bombyx mandarina]